MLILISEVSQSQPFSSNWTPLMRAAYDNDISLAQTLIENGADVDYVDETSLKYGFTALILAVGKGHTEMVDLLIASGADLNLNHPLRTACRGLVTTYNTDIVRSLIDAGADVNNGGDINYTPLMVAAGTANVEAVELLIQKGANVRAVRNSRDSENGYTALNYAYRERYASLGWPTFQKSETSTTIVC